MSTKSQVLTLLMKQTPAFLSGEEMAQRLSLSRTAIWKAINELKKDGYQITSVQNKGYRLEKSDVLSAEGIQLALWPQTPPLTITVLETSESTMTDAKRAILDQTPDNTLIVADMQEMPRGRFGRPFFATPGKGIYMSMVLQPNQNFEEIAQYTVIMAVAVARAMDALAGVHTEIKWVNDLYLNGKKVCGILSEAMSNVETGQISNVIIGMGINFSITETEFPEDIRQKVTSLFPNGEPTATRNELVANIWNHFYQILDERSTKDFLEEYRQRSFVIGKDVAFTQNGQDFRGVATTINGNGELIVQLPDGTAKTLSSGEISLDQIGEWRRG
ncbi:bifunctional ligase/repressor BirA [Enterococcus faecalis]|uniref:biotin--[acetyl-CoA-carboxylase] ligase n=1 Tax=Enterococcus faecalis TaxID=1351 RepID=UPI0001B25996|nr:biotin--[acetyl-CoA-carboxylase] ligase [Enterococcus faecalis]EEU16714.1 biotin-acetyl-CoA-carboxylase ligase [Enterococcus faecalis ATCC 4200]GEB00029.1 bifunctional ligase/repressor BirA [Enterococcus faecalis]VFA51126.1 birA, biotin-[acetyl-CoA-carboxylase] ligase region [Enterococcus faecalis]